MTLYNSEIYQAPEVYKKHSIGNFAEKGQVAVLSECCCAVENPLSQHIPPHLWFQEGLHNKTPHSAVPGVFTPGISPQSLALTCSPRRQGEFGFACTEE